MVVDYVRLEDEVRNDPAGLGYAGKTDQQIADLMNQVGLNEQTIYRDDIPATEVIEAMVSADLVAISDRQLAELTMVTSAGTVDASGPNTRAILAGAFAGRLTTQAALTALQSQSASRAMVLDFPPLTDWQIHRVRAE